MTRAADVTRNATFEAFGGHATLIRDYAHWSVQARPRQATAGAMILLAHGPTQSFADLPEGAHGELARVTRDIETVARRHLGCQKLNYLMLMMVDPHVHFHVLPRYPEPVSFDGIEFADPGWPGPPDLGHAPDAPDAAARVRAELAGDWPGRSA
jgi:diadenosine tetraphosphate (Ap4A) HIT family hydrolase